MSLSYTCFYVLYILSGYIVYTMGMIHVDSYISKGHGVSSQFGDMTATPAFTLTLSPTSAHPQTTNNLPPPRHCPMLAVPHTTTLDP